MPTVTGSATRAFTLLVLLAASSVTAPLPAETASGGAREEKAPPPPKKCCFTNPGYAGTCEAQPAKDETCGSILDYLNNPTSQGKGYCGNTTLRGGWQSVACEAKK